MTGQELVTISLEQSNTSANAIDSDTTAYGVWALRIANIVCEDLYYYLQSRMPFEERNTEIATHNFAKFNEDDYPQGATDVLLLQPEQKIYRVYVKYRQDDEYLAAQLISLNSLARPPKYFAENAYELAPFYTIVGKKIQIFPKPKTEDVESGILVHQLAPYEQMTNLSQNIVGVPADFQRTLIPLMQSYIFERLRRDDDMKDAEKRYKDERKEAAKEVSRRAGDKSLKIFKQSYTL